MRIAYENIIDSLSSASIVASTEDIDFPATNIQDQRLTTKWISTGTTSDSVVFSLDTFPEYPNNATGTTYIQDAWATTDSWATSGASALAVANGVMSVNYNCYRNIASATSKTIIAKVMNTGATAQTLYLFDKTPATTASALTSVTLNYNEWAIISGVSTATAPTTIHLNTYGVTSSHYNVDWTYVGTGVTDTLLLDNSNNENDLIIVSGAVLQNKLYRNGYSSYEYTNNVIANFPNEMHYHVEFPNGLVQKSTRHAFISYSAVMAAVGYLQIRREASSDSLQIGYSSGTFAAVEFANFFTGYSSIKIVLDIYINWVTYEVIVYRNGEYFSSSTMTTPLKPASGQTLYFGRDVGATIYMQGFENNRKLYNRKLLNSEILDLYNGDSFVGENDGLVGDWTLNKGLGINTVAVLGHNLKSGTTIQIQGNSSNNWGSPDVDEIVITNPNVALKFFTETYYHKYWKFTFSQGAVEIGRLWLGSYMTIDPSSLLDFKVTKKNSDIVVHGKNRQKYASPGVTWRQFEFNFPASDEEMIYKISSFFDEVGYHDSFIFCNFDNLREYTLVEPCYCSLSNNQDFSHDERMKWKYSLVMEEEL